MRNIRGWVLLHNRRTPALLVLSILFAGAQISNAEPASSLSELQAIPAGVDRSAVERLMNSLANRQIDITKAGSLTKTSLSLPVVKKLTRSPDKTLHSLQFERSLSENVIASRAYVDSVEEARLNGLSGEPNALALKASSNLKKVGPGPQLSDTQLKKFAAVPGFVPEAVVVAATANTLPAAAASCSDGLCAERARQFDRDLAAINAQETNDRYRKALTVVGRGGFNMTTALNNSVVASGHGEQNKESEIDSQSLPVVSNVAVNHVTNSDNSGGTSPESPEPKAASRPKTIATKVSEQPAKHNLEPVPTKGFLEYSIASAAEARTPVLLREAQASSNQDEKDLAEFKADPNFIYVDVPTVGWVKYPKNPIPQGGEISFEVFKKPSLKHMDCSHPVHSEADVVDVVKVATSKFQSCSSFNGYGGLKFPGL